MTDILRYVDSHIDKDDLSKCVKTCEESAKFRELKTFMDSIMEDFDIHYLYIVRPVMAGDENAMESVMMNIFSADTAYGRATDPDGYYLGCILTDVYEEDVIKLYDDAMNKDDISFFKNFSFWGYDYTALLPLVNSQGEHYAVLCVDIEVAELQRNIHLYTVVNIALIIILGILFILLFLIWMNRNITGPLGNLEQSVVSFATRSHNQLDPALLNYEDPEIHTQNEVESLSDAISQMSADIRDYVKNIIDAQERVEHMKSQVSRMDVIAYQDALTHVKNKAWYDKIEKRVNENISDHTARFALAMIDLNNLKKINDQYGHERGNDYILGACHEICIIFDHSPVFRIGGDEFIVLIENIDYMNKERLISELKTAFEILSADETREPWERYSAAIGMAVYDATKDNSMNDVFKRADEMMYKNKTEIKAGRDQ
ncbi:MAG: GGDEF domain-containing protein [Lachnospiraceae bacterium]|nr:GGDEF domain-containing protein [Lachnospiraceae bacterium]